MTPGSIPRPETPGELTALLFRGTLNTLYGEMTLAARRKRLTEHDITQIERAALDRMAKPEGVEHEFEHFEAELAWRDAETLLKQLFAICRLTREKAIREKP